MGNNCCGNRHDEVGKGHGPAPIPFGREETEASGDSVLFKEFSETHITVTNRNIEIPQLKLIKDESDELTKMKLRELIEISERRKKLELDEKNKKELNN